MKRTTPQRWIQRWVQGLSQGLRRGGLWVLSRLWDELLAGAVWLEQQLGMRRRSVAASDLTRLRQDLLEESRLSWHYLVLVVGSCIIATLGLLANSAAVIIGAMLIAPLMLPIRGAAFGILAADRGLMRASLGALATGSLLAVAIAALLGRLTGVAQFGSEVLARTQPTLLDLGIAVTAGALAGVAKVEPKLSSTAAGTAIAVALMPPICVVGLWLGQGNLDLSRGALLLYLTNLFGITLACMVAFIVFGYALAGRAHRPLGLTLLFTALLALPLGASTVRLLQQNQLEASVKRALLDRTVTFQRLALVTIDANWLASPPEISLTVTAAEPVSPRQVELLEAFLAQELGRPYRLIFLVSPVETITSTPSQGESTRPLP